MRQTGEGVLLDTLILYFLIYSMIGYLVEVVYCSFGTHKLVNRGFLHGPWLPIYGIGALLMIGVETMIPDHIVLIFVVAVVLTSVVEYIGSWLLERLFGIKLWDYSAKRFNINGRVCLKNSLLFGVLGLFLVYGVHPPIREAVASLDEMSLGVMGHLVGITIGVDTSISVMRLLSFTRLLQRYHVRKAEIERRLSALQPTQLRERLKEERSELHEALLERSRRFLAKFPSLTSADLDLKEHLKRLKERYRNAEK